MWSPSFFDIPVQNTQEERAKKSRKTPSLIFTHWWVGNQNALQAAPDHAM
jgi:hypothetical protein